MPILFDLSAFRGTVFVETGTGTGEGAIAAIRAGFQIIHTIERSAAIHAVASQALRDELNRGTASRLFLYHGESTTLLPQICRNHQHQVGDGPGQHVTFFTFWLDANPTTVGDTWPVLDELAIIRDIFRGSLRPPVILINRFGATFQPEAWGGHEVTVQKISAEIAKIDSSYLYDLLPGEGGEQDVLVATPQWLRAAAAYP